MPCSIKHTDRFGADVCGKNMVCISVFIRLPASEKNPLSSDLTRRFCICISFSSELSISDTKHIILHCSSEQSSAWGEVTEEEGSFMRVMCSLTVWMFHFWSSYSVFLFSRSASFDVEPVYTFRAHVYVSTLAHTELMKCNCERPAVSLWCLIVGNEELSLLFCLSPVVQCCRWRWPPVASSVSVAASTRPSSGGTSPALTWTPTTPTVHKHTHTFVVLFLLEPPVEAWTVLTWQKLPPAPKNILTFQKHLQVPKISSLFENCPHFPQNVFTVQRWPLWTKTSPRSQNCCQFWKYSHYPTHFKISSFSIKVFTLPQSNPKYISNFQK